jgi:hypothetical protein
MDKPLYKEILFRIKEKNLMFQKSSLPNNSIHSIKILND